MTHVNIETTSPVHMTPEQARKKIRDGYTGTTSGWSAGWAQANLLAVPRAYAFDLMLFAQRNPKACPLLDVIEPGEKGSAKFHGNVATDVPSYRIYENGRLTDEVHDATEWWRDDLVGFLFGCSFSFEHALTSAGIPMRHTLAGTTVPMYRTKLACETAGRFSSELVVSMRGIPADRVSDAVRISARYPSVHGAPVHIGDPNRIGVDDIEHPDWGDKPVFESDDVPVFWACGVTPQAMVMESHPSFAIAHSPGRMAITDIREADLIVP